MQCVKDNIHVIRENATNEHRREIIHPHSSSNKLMEYILNMISIEVNFKIYYSS